jgi:hypothetical protein
MGAINTAAYLAQIRSRMDAQQQVVALLESELQKSILGNTTTTVGDITGVGGAIDDIYQKLDGTAKTEWRKSIENANVGFDPTAKVDQDALRQLLYQARALLGELRIEEQAWNGEVNSEKTLRKEVNDFAKV